MGFWAWFWIWVGLFVASLAVIALIGKSLLNRSGDVLYQVNRLMPQAQALIEALEAKPTVDDRESDLLAPVSEEEAKRAAFLKQKSKKQARRQRSLRTALKHIDVNESRFTND